jgi:hypothetical protein
MAILYGQQGQLLFYGGLTASRGHEGDSAGIAAIQAILDGRQPYVAHADVFGCPLESPSSKNCVGSETCQKMP